MCFCRGALGVSVWGNEEVHEGVTRTIRSLDNINSMVHSLSNKVSHIVVSVMQYRESFTLLPNFNIL